MNNGEAPFLFIFSIFWLIVEFVPSQAT